jgi:hypothetical protein
MKRIVVVTLSCCLATVSTIAHASSKQGPQGINMPISKSPAKTENCAKYDRKVETSLENKTVELKKFGVKIQIPKNHRTLLSNKGEVWILNPVDYDLLACFARGGKGGGRGMYYSFVKSHPNRGVDLKSFVRGLYGANSSIEPYSLSGLTGLLVEESPLHRGLISSSFFIQIPGIQNIVEIGAGCDCDVKAKNIKGFLTSVSLL